jgi:hypothetical protein
VITADRWYNNNPDFNLHFQGDVVADIPFPMFPPILPASKEESWPILRPMRLKGRTVEQAMRQLPFELLGKAAKDVPDAWALPSGEWGVVQFRKQHVMIVSRSCALDNPSRKHVLAAPVRPVDTLPEQERLSAKLDALRINEIPHFFYLPETSGFPESYADLLVLTPIHRTFFADELIASQLVVRLSEVGQMALQHAMSDHFGTKFGFDQHDMCTQGGRYSCSNCFHSGNEVKVRTMAENRPFGTCEGCGEEAAWIKLPV